MQTATEVLPNEKTTVKIVHGNCLSTLPLFPPQSVQCCVTSPPYWGLRDYGHASQIGQEPTPEGFIESLVTVFREVRRVLADDGTLWLNLGDSYCSQGGSHDGRSDNNPGVGAARVWRNGIGRADGVVDERGQRNRNGNTVKNLKSKDLVGVPWRVALALQADGWFLRSDIIWYKPNPMPESVTDRPTKSHEYLFLMSKSRKYYYDAEAIAEPVSSTGGGNFSREYADAQPGHGAMQLERPDYQSRNKRSVWTVPTAHYTQAHFATFPPNLIKPCILAGTKPGDTVLDPFAGSGTTGMVAIELGRRATLIELNPDYVKLCHRRCTTTHGLAL